MTRKLYQALPYDRGAWHVGVNYGGRLFGICNNHNSIGIEMCVNAGYDYEKAFRNTAQVCKILMKQYGINADHVVQHYDVCAKNCPSAIRAKGDWNRFKLLIGSSETVAVEKYYRIRKKLGRQQKPDWSIQEPGKCKERMERGIYHL